MTICAALILGYVTGVAVTMASITQSLWWTASIIVMWLLIMSGKPISRLADRWMKK
jgi:hypothetical protein